MCITDWPFVLVLDAEREFCSFLVFDRKNVEDWIFSVHSLAKKPRKRNWSEFILMLAAASEHPIATAWDNDSESFQIRGRLHPRWLLEVIGSLLDSADLKVTTEGDDEIPDLALRMVDAILTQKPVETLIFEFAIGR